MIIPYQAKTQQTVHDPHGLYAILALRATLARSKLLEQELRINQCSQLLPTFKSC